uniref:(northern house mosquito) hypothetical protein n=1 Tax=Culex pipiens TaxID=7175 RepID=A0A8D8C8K8_CULPI
MEWAHHWWESMPSRLVDRTICHRHLVFRSFTKWEVTLSTWNGRNLSLTEAPVLLDTGSRNVNRALKHGSASTPCRALSAPSTASIWLRDDSTSSVLLLRTKSAFQNSRRLRS